MGRPSRPRLPRNQVILPFVARASRLHSITHRPVSGPNTIHSHPLPFPLLTVLDEFAADTHPDRPDGAEIDVAPHGTRGAGPNNLVEANNEEDGFMDDESWGGDETWATGRL